MKIQLESIPIVTEKTNWRGDNIESLRHTEYAIRLTRTFKFLGIATLKTHYFLRFHVGPNAFQDIKSIIQGSRQQIEVDMINESSYSDVFCTRFFNKKEADDVIGWMISFPDRFLQ